MNKKEDNKQAVTTEDSTKYGEFVSSFFSWIGLGEQKEKASKLEKINKNKK